MITEKVVLNEADAVLAPQATGGLLARLGDYNRLIKLRLSLLVLFSAAIGYLMAGPASPNWGGMGWLLLGGLLVTAAANAINQLIEQKQDGLMHRTALRPLPTGRMSRAEVMGFVAVSGLLGAVLLAWKLNPATALLALLSLVLYAFCYTPMKRFTPWAVWVGALPGAMPLLIGWVAGAGTLTAGGWVLFALQFMWQFPHFWAIAWVGADDYRRAGYQLLPSRGGQDGQSARLITLSTCLLVPLAFLPFAVGLSGIISAWVCAGAGLLFALLTLRLVFTPSRRAALAIMFGSFVYLPVALLALYFDKI